MKYFWNCAILRGRIKGGFNLEVKEYENRMYYFYNRVLGSILTVNGWFSLDSMSLQIHQLVAVKDSLGLTKTMCQTCGKVAMYQTIIVSDEKIRTGLPSLVQATDSVIKATEKAAHILLTYLRQEGTLEQVKSTEFFPFVPVPRPQAVTDILEKPTQELDLNSGLSQEREMIKMFKQFDEEEMLSLKSNFKVGDYEFAKEITTMTTMFQRVFSHAEEITLYYDTLLKEIEQQIEDELHFVEFSAVNVEVSVITFQKLQDLRLKRRCVKDSIVIANLLLKTNLSEGVSKLQKVAERISDMDDRSYLVKQPDEFHY